ncbi:uncharacterized protein LOC122718047 isoform X1 [Apis laboriosa]|uniref:uncharacterized protein LOC100870692 n=1 Tax=Apis florea TaxID=7463 RepID=UPI0003DF5493|nr:uncharacterized protein LOC100870692 [Apis florea]XP_006621630.1 uncharacterized protein LOC102681874 [Apis dorsata]XP_031369107.1 uncharacterized protein LOC102681874 [Apis dorsata]XP_043798651.1 uncharacterized protein LOC122718047 isoform X1 [Apis laboriosa]
MVHKVHRMEEECSQENKKVETTMQTTVAVANTSSDDVCNARARVSCQEEFTCSLYISRAVGPQGQVQGIQSGGELLRSNLEEVIRASDPLAAWHVSETPCGLIAAFTCEADAEKLLQRGDLARVFEGPVQVARFSAKDSRYRQAVLLRDVPWAIPLQDINSALMKQGIATGSVERWRQYIRVEVLDAGHYELLLRQGLDFFGAARFSAIPERWWRGGTGSTGGPLQAGPGIVSNFLEASNFQTGDGVLQCYRCQGFWHMAANCRHLPRCVRCGEPHSVEFCPRPRNNPICCHCSGPHHAGYRQCPVRQQLSNATPISITLSTTRIGNQYPMNAASKTNASAHEQQPLKSSQS